MNRSLTYSQELDVMNFDPWGDRDATYRVLTQSFVTTRKDHVCSICFEVIPTGTRVWIRREVDDGQAGSFYFCAECCWCIAHRNDESDDDPGFGWERMDQRWEIGRVNAEARRAKSIGDPA